MPSEKKTDNQIEKYFNRTDNDEILDLDVLDQETATSDVPDQQEMTSSDFPDVQEPSATDLPDGQDTAAEGLSAKKKEVMSDLSAGKDRQSREKTDPSSVSTSKGRQSQEKADSSGGATSKNIQSREKTDPSSVSTSKGSQSREKADPSGGASSKDRQSREKTDAPCVSSSHDVYQSSAEARNIGKETQPDRTKFSPFPVLTVILSLTTLVCVLLCLYLLSTMVTKTEETLSEEVTVQEEGPEIVLYDQMQVDALIAEAKEEASSQKEDEIKEYIRSIAELKNPNFAEMLRKLYPEDVVYLDTDGYHFVPVNDSLGLNNIQDEQLFTDGAGNFTYVEDSVVTSSRGIDVSQHQGTIDWQQVADSGIEFAIIRVGFRGYGSGALVLDDQFQKNIEGATNAGIEVGVYFFTQAINAEEAVEEAQFVLDAIAPYTISGPVVIDVEKPDDSSARGNAITAVDRTGYVKLFCQAIEKEGYTPMIYGNTYSMFAMLDVSQLTDYAKWFAFYNDYLYYPYEVDIWQYSATATVPGISGNVDMNIRFQTN